MQRFFRMSGLLTAMFLFVMPLAAQEKKDDKAGAQPEKKQPAKDDSKTKGTQPPAGEGGTDPMAAMMEAWAKTAAPGKHHEHLKPMAGKWDATGKFRMSPEAPWDESNSKVVSEWVFGGRFLTSKVNGESMMEGHPPFEGFGILGYDNMTQKYTSVWMDNMATMVMTSEGTCDATGKEFNFGKCEFTCPMTNQPTWLRSVYKIESNDKFTLSMYGPDMTTGKEFMNMEITYTRSK